ncbi:hypothetical protein CGCFRS4_v015948 [Colletotrichum fructicola]|nr:hypothetical protein CGCFRS4_v015948 [Colletotrichum fructicola]
MTVERTKHRLLPSGARRLDTRANRRSKKVPVCSSVSANDAVESVRDFQATNARDVINSGLGKPPTLETNDRLLATILPQKQPKRSDQNSRRLFSRQWRGFLASYGSKRYQIQARALDIATDAAFLEDV